jgi:putative ABC transport system substrate-binding protein
LVSGEGDLYAHRQLIAELTQKNRLPAMCPCRDYVEAGGLMAYTVDLAELLRRMADDVHKILHGAKPGDIPIYQPTKFQLLINLKTAKALGLTLPLVLLARADCACRGRRPRCPAHGDHVIRSMTTGAAHELDGAVGFIF